MICLEVLVNSERYCLAGVGEKGVLSAFVTWANFGEAEEAGIPNPPGSIMLSVNGITSDKQSVHWGTIGDHLKKGDEVTIRIIDSDSPDTWTLTPLLPEMDEDSGDSA